MNDVDLDGLASDLGFVLKVKQKEAVESLLRGKDVFGVFPTGFGKSLIFQLFVLAKNRASSSPNAVSRKVNKRQATHDSYMQFVSFVHLPFVFRSFDLFVA